MTTGELLMRAWGNTFTTGLPTNLALFTAVGAVVVKWRRLRTGAAWCALCGFGLWLVVNFLHPLLMTLILSPGYFDSDISGTTAQMMLLQWVSTAAYTLTFLLILAAVIIGPRRHTPPPLPSLSPST